MRRLTRPSSGFTLIEVLVTLAILLFGLMGLAGLIVKGQRAAYEAYQRHQALSIATDLAERMKANQSNLPSTYIVPGQQDNLSVAALYVAGAPVATPLGDPTSPTKWNGLTDGSIVNCGTATCKANCTAAVALPPTDENYKAALRTCMQRLSVDYDLALWEGQLIGITERRAADAVNVGGIVNARGCVEGPLGGSSPPNTYRVSVAWQGDVPTFAPTSSACGTGLYRNNTGAVDETTRRVVSLDVTVLAPL